MSPAYNQDDHAMQKITPRLWFDKDARTVCDLLFRQPD